MSLTDAFPDNQGPPFAPGGADPDRSGNVVPFSGAMGAEITVAGDSSVVLSEAEFADQLEALTRDIEYLERNAIFRIAAHIAKAHELFLHRRDEGGFQGWAENRLGYSRSHAYRLLDVGRWAKVSQPWDAFGTLPVSAIYLLAAPSTPDDVRNEIAERIKAGEKVSCAAVTEAITQVKNKATNSADENETEGADGEGGEGTTPRAKSDGGERSKPRQRKPRFNAADCARVLGLNIQLLATLPEMEDYGEKNFGLVLDHILGDADFIDSLVELARHPKVGAIIAAVIAKLGESPSADAAPAGADLDVRTFAGGSLQRCRS